MGLDVHDMENLGRGMGSAMTDNRKALSSAVSHLRLARPFRTGIVLTIEPGIYFYSRTDLLLESGKTL